MSEDIFNLFKIEDEKNLSAKKESIIDDLGNAARDGGDNRRYINQMQELPNAYMALRQNR